MYGCLYVCLYVCMYVCMYMSTLLLLYTLRARYIYIDRLKTLCQAYGGTWICGNPAVKWHLLTCGARTWGCEQTSRVRGSANIAQQNS